MNTTKTAVVMMGLCTALFTSCQKDSYMTPDGATVQGQQLREGEGSNITLNFTGGKMTTASISVMDNQNVVAENRNVRVWSLFDPIVSQGLPLRPGPYTNLVTRMHQMPMEESPVLRLTGMMTLSNNAGMAMGRNFDFDIMTPMELEGSSGMINMDGGTTLINLLNLKMDQMGTGISEELWKRAMEGGEETIHISERSNPELYQIMLKNLQAMMVPGTGTPPSGGVTTQSPSLGDGGPTATM